MAKPDTAECQYAEFPVCPHCGAVDQNWYDGLTHDEASRDGDTWTIACHACDKDYRVWLHVDLAFTTDVGREADG